MQTKTKICSFAISALLSLSALGQSDTNVTAVFFPVHTMSGANQGRRLTITPYVNPEQLGTNIYWGLPISTYPSNGVAWVNLAPNQYEVAMDGMSKTFTIWVPATNVAQDVRWLTTNLFSYAPVSLGGGSTIDPTQFQPASSFLTNLSYGVGTDLAALSPSAVGSAFNQNTSFQWNFPGGFGQVNMDYHSFSGIAAGLPPLPTTYFWELVQQGPPTILRMQFDSFVTFTNGLATVNSTITNSGVVWVTGSGAPSGTWPVASIYSRKDTGDQYLFKSNAWHLVTAP